MRVDRGCSGFDAERGITLSGHREVELELGRTGAIEGTLRHLDGRSAGLVYVDLAMFSPGSSCWWTPTRTDLGGHFRIEGLVPGRYGVAPQASTWFPSQQELEVFASQTTRIELFVSALPRPVLRGAVTFDNGSPVAYAQVARTQYLTGEDFRQFALSLVEEARERTDSAGRFTVRAPYSQDHWVGARAAGIVSTLRGPVRVTEPIHIRLPRMVDLHGTVSGPGGPIPRFRLSFAGRDNKRSDFFTSTDGSWMMPAIPEGEVTVKVVLDEPGPASLLFSDCIRAAAKKSDAEWRIVVDAQACRGASSPGSSTHPTSPVSAKADD